MQPTCLTTPILLLQGYYQYVLIESSTSSSAANDVEFAHLQDLQVTSSLMHALAKQALARQALAKQAHALERLNVEDKFFTSHGFIPLVTCTTSILSWILEKSLLKPKKNPYLHKKASKPKVQYPW